MKDYGKMTLSQLKINLKSRGAKISGRKRELVERLEAYDRNSNFNTQPEEVNKEYEMILPSSSNYKDVNKDTEFPVITYNDVRFYLQPLGKQLDIETVKNLYDQRFLKYFRSYKDSDSYFVRSECKAEMRKNMSYHVDVKIGFNDGIKECQCECAVGMGPTAHCKHVSTVLYACCQFLENQFIQTEETCTQQLQTFHQSKPYYGSPIKACKLPLSANLHNVRFDPRPVEFRNLEYYPYHFRSVWLNHPRVNSIPISQFYAPANPNAVDYDHDYLLKSLSDQWLDKMYITSITSQAVQDIEVLTRGQSNSKAWCYERRKRLHSSVFGRICTATDKTDHCKLAQSFVKVTANFSSPPLAHGKRCESIAIKKYEEISKLLITPCGTFVSEKYPFLASSPDGIINDEELLEVKCPYTARNDIISPKTVPYLEETNNGLNLKTTHPYYYQVQGQLMCCGRRRCVFIIYTFVDIKHFIIERNDKFIDTMVDKLSCFFNTFFKQAVLDQFYYRNFNKLAF